MWPFVLEFSQLVCFEVCPMCHMFQNCTLLQVSNSILYRLTGFTRQLMNIWVVCNFCSLWLWPFKSSNQWLSSPMSSLCVPIDITLSLPVMELQVRSICYRFLAQIFPLYFILMFNYLIYESPVGMSNATCPKWCFFFLFWYADFLCWPGRSQIPGIRQSFLPQPTQ